MNASLETQTPWFDTLGVFDLETTGIEVETSRIVSAHVGVINSHGESVEFTDWLADPAVEIPAQASAIHGISTERAREEGRPAVDVIREIVASVRAILDRKIPLVIFNAPYDLTVLNREAVRHGIPQLIAPSPVIDPLVIDKAVDRYRKGKRTLEAAAANYGVELTAAHDAAADAVAAGRVAQAIGRRFSSELGADITAIHLLQVGWSADQAASFQDYMRRTRDPQFVANGGWPER